MNTLAQLLATKKQAATTGQLTPSDKQFVEQYYQQVLGKPFVARGCGKCYHDALIEMYTARAAPHAPVQQYQLRNGVVLQLPSLANVYTNANLTDQVAIQYLSQNKQGIHYFATYPTHWLQDIDKQNETTTTPAPIQVIVGYNPQPSNHTHHLSKKEKKKQKYERKKH